MFTATQTPGKFTVTVHAAGCSHTIDPDRVVGSGVTVEETMAQSVRLIDPDGDHPVTVWKKRLAPCAKTLG